MRHSSFHHETRHKGWLASTVLGSALWTLPSAAFAQPLASREAARPADSRPDLAVDIDVDPLAI